MQVAMWYDTPVWRRRQNWQAHQPGCKEALQLGSRKWERSPEIPETPEHNPLSVWLFRWLRCVALQLSSGWILQVNTQRKRAIPGNRSWCGLLQVEAISWETPKSNSLSPNLFYRKRPAIFLLAWRDVFADSAEWSDPQLRVVAAHHVTSPASLFPDNQLWLNLWFRNQQYHS